MNSRVQPIPAVDTASRWDAWLDLTFASGPRGSQLTRCRHDGPLYVQKAFYPEGRERAHAYLLHPPGGMVSGDDLRIGVEVQAGAGALLTTPGAGRAYGARPDRTLQYQRNRLTVAKDATLEWLPQETLLYPNARARLDTDVELAEGARFIGWDITCLGLPASGQAFDRGELRQRLQIRRNGRLVLREQLHLTERNRTALNGRLGFRQCPVNALMVAGPFAGEQPELIERLRACCAETQGEDLAAVTRVDAFILVRFLGRRAEPARRLFTECWTRLRPALLTVPACPPRIWAT